MSTRVICDPSINSGGRCVQAIGQLLDARDDITRLAECLYSMIYTGNGADMAAVEEELGLPAGKGQQAFDLISAARAALNDARIVALREMDQG